MGGMGATEHCAACACTQKGKPLDSLASFLKVCCRLLTTSATANNRQQPVEQKPCLQAYVAQLQGELGEAQAERFSALAGVRAHRAEADLLRVEARRGLLAAGPGKGSLEGGQAWQGKGGEG